jgi:membrane protease YdiL (CAAX protease family)
VDKAEQPSGWGIIDAAIVGAVWYAGTILFLDLSIFAVYSTPSLHSALVFYQLDANLPVFVGVLGGILLVGPLVMWVVHKRRIGSFGQSIQWGCSNRVVLWASLAGLASGICYSFAKGLLLGSGYQIKGLAYIAAFIGTAGLVEPLAEEIYFRGVLFVALADRFGKIPSIAIVTVLFSLVHPSHFLTVLPLAILLAGTRLYSSSVRACFACHAAYNLSLALFMFPISR